MTKAIRFEETGGPEILQWLDIPEQTPGPGEALIAHEAIRVNFLDVAQRRGAVKVPLPSGLGLEAAGRVIAVGLDTTRVSPGGRVVYALGHIGAYAETRLYPANRLIALPDEIAFDDAASIFLKGLTAHYLLHDTYKIEPGTHLLLYGASGGLGQILAAWAASKDARVIGVVSGAPGVEIAKRAGCEDVLVWSDDDLAEQVKALTSGRGVDVVYDGVGKDTFDASIDSLRRRGTMVSIGATSGLPGPVSVARLNAASLFLTRPGLADHIADRREYHHRADDLFEAIKAGSLKPSVAKTFDLEDAAAAHRALEDRSVKGSIVLKPK